MATGTRSRAKKVRAASRRRVMRARGPLVQALEKSPPVAVRRAPQAPPQIPADVLVLQRVVGNRVILRQAEPVTEEVKEAEKTEAPADEKDLPVMTGYVGLNPQAGKEAKALEHGTKGNLIVSLNDPKAEAGFDTEIERAVWVYRALDINPLTSYQKFTRAVACLEECDPKFREQMGAMMKMFRGSELGQYRLERLVMSGHSNGVTLWGDEEGEHRPGGFIYNRDFTNLAKAFPGGARQVKHIMFSACWTAGTVEILKDLFVNLETVWSYAGFSPSIKQGSARHIAKWEERTRGERQPRVKDARGNAAIWSRDQGWIVNDPADQPLDGLIVYANSMLPRVTKQKDGEEPVAKSFLRSYYEAIQRILLHPDCSPELKEKANYIMGVVLRLRLFKLVCKRFATEFRTEIDAAYKQLGEFGVKEPKWASLDRIKLKAHKDACYDALTQLMVSVGGDLSKYEEAEDYVKQKLDAVLWELDPKVIDDTWL